MDRIGPGELFVIALLVLIVFGSKRLPDVARSLGRSARVFKSEVDEMKRESEVSKSEAATASALSEPIEPVKAVELAAPAGPVVPTTGGGAVHENASRTDNEPGPVA